MHIDIIEKAIKVSLEETPKRTRRADEEPKKSPARWSQRGDPEAGGGLGGVHKVRGRADVLP
jgi:hypothetical protein